MSGEKRHVHSTLAPSPPGHSDSVPPADDMSEIASSGNSGLNGRLSEEQLDFVLQGANDGLWYWDVPSGDEWWSTSFRELVGYTEEDLPASFESWKSLLHPDDQDAVIKALNRHVEESESYDVEYRMRTGHRGFRWFHARGRSERDADGRATRMGGSIQDITESKEAEHGLRLYAQITEHMVEGVCLTRMGDGVIVYANPRFEQAFGYGPGELTDQPVAILNASSQQHPEERAEEIIQSVKQQGFWSGEVHNVKKDGTEFWSWANAVTFEHSEHGTVLLAVQEDITERKEAEHGLRLNAQIMEHMAEGVTLIRMDDQLMVYANPRLEEIFGYGSGELTGQHITMLNASSERSPEETAYEIARGVLEKGYWSGEIHNVKKDGTKFWTWANITTFEHREFGKVFISVSEDITERVEAAAALLESEQRLGKILDSILTFVGLYTIDGVLIEANRAPLEAASLTRDDVVGKPFWETYWWSYSKDVQDKLRDALRRAAQGETVRYDALVRVGESENGKPELITLDVTFGPLFNAEGEVVQLVGSAVDISERVRAEEERLHFEEQMQQSQKLESLGVLAGGIAHDFNNLLVAILGNAQLALTEMSPTSRSRGYISDIETASERAADLCRQMLAYSGRGRFVLESLNLNAILYEMGQLLKMSIGKKVTLEYDLMPDLPSVKGDATQIRQIVMNLVTNASEAIGDRSGTIDISTGTRNCDAEYLASTWLDEGLPSGSYVYFKFRDTGAGMTPEDLERIFDPFFTTKFTGRGLGLAAVLGIVRGHQGAMKVASSQGDGTTFTVLLPVQEFSQEIDVAERKVDDSFSALRGTVLLADDEPIVRDAASNMLHRAGFPVLMAADGYEAVELYKEHGSSICCILLDLTMPKMDGEEAFDELRRLGCEAPIVLCSGFDAHEIMERFSGKDVAGFLQKPYRLQEFLDMLKSVSVR